MEERTTLLEKLSENFVRYAERIALSDNINTKGTTYHELDIISGKVYSYLSKKGIGPEDFVMINLPRSSMVFAVCIGVWRAGAALTICEEGYPKEKIDYIYNDCKCKLKITFDRIKEILSEPYKEGYVHCDEHTAAYAGYTSGTTGNPKGIIHEIGTLINNRKSHVYQGKEIFQSGDVAGLIAPLNFAAAIILMNPILYAGGQLAVVPYEYGKNPEKLRHYFEAKKVTVSFLTPSLAKIFEKMPKSMRVLILAGEPSSDIYFEGLDVYNFYAQTETGCLCALFELNRPYSVTPIGQSQIPELNLQVLDENNEKCAPGQMGELCLENRFFRGYIGLEEMTEQAKRGGIYHTGDIGKYLEDGNIVLLGRNDDMVKINGNRVEPAEIEKVLKEVLKVKWAAAKAIKSEKRTFICAYYDEDLTVDMDQAKKTIAEKLPAYMVPSYYMHIDQIPLNANGKFARKGLPEPDLNDYIAKNYIAPENEVQKSIVEAFEKILKIEKVGIDDDFYESGGDSISSMEAVSLLSQLNLSVSDIFKGRTARKIDELLSQKQRLTYSAEENEKALKQEYCLTPFQLYVFDYQLYTPNSTMWNLPFFCRIHKSIPEEKLIEALRKVIKAHPALRTKLHFDADQNLVQYLDDSEPTIEFENVTEAEMIDIREELIHPFKMIDSPLFRYHLFKTEKNIYLFLDIHHIVSDGSSIRVLLSDLFKAIQGEELEKDFYYLVLKEKEWIHTTGQYMEDQAYYQNLYGNTDWIVRPQTDYEDRSNKTFTIHSDIPVNEEDYQKLMDKYGVSENALFIAITLLAQAQICQAQNVLLTWTFNGRDDVNKQNIVGNLLCDLPVGVKIGKTMTVYDFMQDIKNQVSGGLSHTAYPYSLMEDDRAGLSDRTCFLYQRNIFNIETLLPESVDVIELISHYDGADNLLDVEVIDNGRGKSLSITYESTRYKEETMQDLRRCFQKIAARLVQYADQEKLMVNEILK